MDRNAFAGRVRAALDRLGATNAALAKAAGVSAANVTHWLNGTTDPSAIQGGNLVGAARFLGMTVEELLTGRVLPREDPDTPATRLAREVEELAGYRTSWLGEQVAQAFIALATVLAETTPGAARSLDGKLEAAMRFQLPGVDWRWLRSLREGVEKATDSAAAGAQRSRAAKRNGGRKSP